MALTPEARRHVAEGVAVAAVTGHNWLSNRHVPNILYVPASLGAAVGLVAVGRWGGATPSDLGVARADVGRGVATGAAAAGAVLGVVMTAARSPKMTHWFADDRMLRLTPREALYETWIRIPLGTAVGEELAFRSALLGLSLRHRSWKASAVMTSALFGLWHVLPTLETLPQHLVGRAAIENGHATRAVAFAVGSTTAAGLGFAWLRKVSGSVVAPILVHAMANAAALLAARRLGRLAADA